MTSGCYVLKNNINDKCYVGQSASVEQRLKTHNIANTDMVIHKAIRLYGFNNFSIKIVQCPIEELDELEEFLISEICTLLPKGYNVTSGGGGVRGFIHSQDSRKRMSVAKSGHVASPETKRKMSLAKKGMPAWNKGKPAWNKGISPSAETCDKISLSRKGKQAWNKGIPMSEEARVKLSEANKGKSISAETRLKIRLSLIGYKRGPLSSETRAKISESKKGTVSPNKGKSKNNYTVTWPNGTTEVVYCLPEFCMIHGLNYSCMWKVANLKSKQHRGFKCCENI